MKAIIGLGNPGSEYKDTRHNAGFETVNKLCDLKQIGVSPKFEKRFHADIVRTSISAQDILLVKPVTYMNDSGKTVLALKNYYKIQLKSLLIVHDDVSLPLGKIRLQKAGGAGGQHGVESIIEHLGGEKAFNRLKIGIGPDPGGDIRHRYVLQRFSEKEKLTLNKVIDTACEAIVKWITSDIETTMNEFNGKTLD